VGRVGRAPGLTGERGGDIGPRVAGRVALVDGGRVNERLERGPRLALALAHMVELKKLEILLKGFDNLKLFVGHEGQLKQAITKEYIKDLRIITEKVVKGETVGRETEDKDPQTGGLSATYGQMQGLIYKPNNIFKNKEQT